MDPILEEILNDEIESFRQEARQTYVKLADVAQITPNLEEAVLIIGSSPAKRYTSIAIAALNKHKIILLAGKGLLLGKLVSIVELIKQRTEGRVVQLNRASLTESLVNPEFKPNASLNNVRAFFGDKVDTDKSPNGDKTAERSEYGEASVEALQGSIKPASSTTSASVAVVSAVKRLILGPKIYQVPAMSVVLAIGDLTLPGGSWTKQVKG